MTFMRHSIYRQCLLWLPCSLVLLSSCLNSSRWTVKDRTLNDYWEMQSSRQVTQNGNTISDTNFIPDKWYKAEVPGTVLGSLVADSVFNDVFFHRNLEKIPDSLFEVPWWYRSSFAVSDLEPGQLYRLRFNGISYRADIWLNGHKIASADTLEGSFRQYTLDVTPYVREGENVLALNVIRAAAGDLNIGFVDWNPEPADHNMGIWRNVHLLATGPVSIENPFVETAVDTTTLDHADITLHVTLTNHSDKDVEGIFQANIGDDIQLSKTLSLKAGEVRQLTLSPAEYAALSMDHPRLWWTYQLGKPNLYPLKMNFKVQNELSDDYAMKFGIRSVSGYMTPEGFRGYKLNGKKILIKGGGWTDPMLLNASPAYEQAGIDYAVQMHLNTIRMEGFWGKNQHLYDLCDERGILMMVGFSCQWEWANYFGTKDDQYGAISTPAQIDMAARSWRDQLTWLRNHPSIMLWMYGSDKIPRPELEKRYLKVLKETDPTRPYVQSAQEHVSSITGPTGMKMRGPYDYVPPVYWYIDTLNGGAFGFNTETGPGPEIPVLESLKKMIPADSLWPISDAWLYHAARGEFHNFTAYNKAMDQRLGKPSGLEDYLRKAQLLNYEGMRAMFESFEANRFKATGIIQWMYNASWPKLWWQLYDYYLMPTGAFYGARKACEPIHIAYNYGTHSVEAFNNTLAARKGLSCDIGVYDTSMHKVFEKQITLNDLAAQSTQPLLGLPENLALSSTYFLDLRLYDSLHHVISTNFYALSTKPDKLDEGKSTWYITPQSDYADLRLLQQLPAVHLDAQTSVSQREDTTFVQVELKNPSKQLAFMVHLDLKNKTQGQSVTPVFWDDNYLSLLPGEERTVSGYCHTGDLKGQAPVVKVTGWNVQ